MKKKGLTFYWGQGHLEVDIQPSVPRDARVLSGLELTIAVALCVAVIMRAGLFSVWVFSGLLTITLGLLASVVIRAVHRFTFREKIFLDSTHITLVQSYGFSKSVRSFDLNTIGELHYLQSPEDPLAPACRPGDLFCDAHAPQLRRALAERENLCFSYAGEQVFFGRGVYSWHAEELAMYFQLYCGNAIVLGPEWEALLQDAGEME